MRGRGPGRRWKPGECGNPARRWRPGQSGNPRGRWRRGESGNPHGRPFCPVVAARRLWHLDPARALALLTRLLRGRGMVAVKAASAILDLGLGRV